MNNEQLQVGDRVELVDLWGYLPEESQGLLVGNTATVVGLWGNKFLLRTDNAVTERDATGDGEGWIFPATSLRKLAVMELPDGFTRNPGERRVPDDVMPETCVTVIYRDGARVTDTAYADPAYWSIRDGGVSTLDIIGYKIEDDSACGVNS